MRSDIFRSIYRSTALLALAAMAACGGGEPERPPVEAGDYETLSGGPPGGTLVVLASGSDGEPDDLNPLTYASAPASQLTHLIFRTLARRDSTLSSYVPDLAREWELRPDSTLVLRLRDDVYWHDGEPVTAEDVVFTIERQRDELLASPRQADVAAVERVTAPDSFTVEVKLARPGPYAVNALLEVMPVPEHLLADVPVERMKFAPFSRSPVGNGLFRFAKWDPGQQVVLEANLEAPENRPALDRVIMRFVPDMNAAMTELLSGQGDVLKIPPEQRDRVEAAPDVELYSAARVRPAWIAWNVDRAPVNDPRVRQALLMGTDREALAEGLFGDVGEVALSPFPPRLWEHDPNFQPIPYDPVAAGNLLQQAGWVDRNGDGIREKDGRPLVLEVDVISSDQVRQDVLVAMQAMWRQIGAQLKIRPFERTAWVERLRARDFQGSMWGWGWGPGVVGPNAEMVFHSRSLPPGGANFAGYRNPRVDALIDSALVVTDTARARRIWSEIEREVSRDAAYAPLYLDPELFGVSERFANVRFPGIEWWEDVHNWYVPVEKRLPRDRAGLTAAR